MSLTTISRTAETSAPIHEVLAERWSPRSFDSSVEVPSEKITAALEAARWSASAANTQPWRFIVARRGTTEHDTIVENLMGFNQVWASSAQVLIVNLAAIAAEDGTPLRWSQYDLGQAVANLTVQAHHDGLHVHQMGGIEVDGLREAFDIDANLEPISVTALGVLGTPEALTSDVLREREVAPRSRRPLEEIVLVSA
ncbi:nitroreductase [Mycetocola manganoxydans]|uniref:Nitroreductase n=1 Tax=Mycetocola manganoxydans TaxID=699879 RepID=A0A3L7A0L7_9MICO|nr:nitroreductase family protein [Mycetocola manganoxydans]RLP72992.1 nitroreductase [Mycetocola manganoxydans]GHD44644.1 nitroreductase [Mycetocola manganoxydans]